METLASKALSGRLTHVLVVAAGTGSRMGGNGVPKQYMPLGGKPVLRRTVERFLNLSEIETVRVVIHPEHRDLYDDAMKGLDLPAPVTGGGTRQESVRNGLKALQCGADDFVLIHDAARPFVEKNEIIRIIESLKDNSSVSLAAPLADTAVSEKDHYIDPAIRIDRAKTRLLQTPQGFRYGAIRKAHENALINNVSDATDDTALMHALGIPTRLIRGKRSNFKITTQEDREMAEKLVDHRYEFRSGTGFDVHAFSTKPAESVRLCGLDIPCARALDGHSDADVGLHALTDAILGAIGAGDIGLHFPPSNPEWKNADSAIFLQQAIKLMAGHHARLVNADITLICESPKIGPYREEMRERVANILSVSQSRVNIKATTTEKLGFTGRGEGVAAQAVVALECPEES